MPTYPQIFAVTGRNYTRDVAGRPAVTAKTVIVLHSTGAARPSTAAAEAAYAVVRTDIRSAHYYVDRHRVIQSLDTDWRAWHLKSRRGNDRGIAYELVGHASYSREQWLTEIAWDALAEQIARDVNAHRIQIQPLTISQIRTGKLTGIITGEQARQAWGGTQRTGPGLHFPMDHLLRLVAEKADRLTAHPMAAAAAAPVAVSAVLASPTIAHPPPQTAPPAAPHPTPETPRHGIRQRMRRILTALHRYLTGKPEP